MLKISIVDSPSRRRLVLEGVLVAPWVSELCTAWTRAHDDLEGRDIVLDFANVTPAGRPIHLGRLAHQAHPSPTGTAGGQEHHAAQSAGDCEGRDISGVLHFEHIGHSGAEKSNLPLTLFNFRNVDRQ
jgi:hypothetical protein